VSRIWKILVFAAAAAAIVGLSSCKFVIPPDAYNYISEEQLRELKAMGLPINDGSNPPDVTGTYLCDSLVLKNTNISNDFELGHPFANMEIEFDNQNSDGTVRVSYWQGSESGTGLGAYISGWGNRFTIYAQIIGTSSGINFTDAMVFSGTMSSSGIKNFVYALLMTDKDYDPTPYLIEIGGGRVIEENDGLAANYTGVFSVFGGSQQQLPAGNAR
jgi:hypothetical protein